MAEPKTVDTAISYTLVLDQKQSDWEDPKARWFVYLLQGLEVGSTMSSNINIKTNQHGIKVNLLDTLVHEVSANQCWEFCSKSSCRPRGLLAGLQICNLAASGQQLNSISDPSIFHTFSLVSKLLVRQLPQFAVKATH